MRSTTSRPTYSACDASDASCAIFLHLVIHWRLPGMDALNVLGRLKVGGINLHMIDLGGDVTGNGVSTWYPTGDPVSPCEIVHLC